MMMMMMMMTNLNLQDLGQLLTVTSLSNLTHLTSLELNFYDGECPSCVYESYLRLTVLCPKVTEISCWRTSCLRADPD